LPWPPSINGYWRSISRGKYASQIISEDGRIFRSNVALVFKLAPKVEQFTGRLAVEIDLVRPTHHRFDLDNMPKGIFDALTHAKVWKDDSQVDLMTVRRAPVVAGCDPHAIVTIRELEAQS
jgi:crossover junction endodeoxyribonuclease RusA